MAGQADNDRQGKDVLTAASLVQLVKASAGTFPTQTKEEVAPSPLERIVGFRGSSNVG